MQPQATETGNASKEAKAHRCLRQWLAPLFRCLRGVRNGKFTYCTVLYFVENFYKGSSSCGETNLAMTHLFIQERSETRHPPVFDLIIECAQ